MTEQKNSAVEAVAARLLAEELRSASSTYERLARDIETGRAGPHFKAALKAVERALASLPAASEGEAVALDWLTVAKAAGEHGIRYRTNRALVRFLTQIGRHPAPSDQEKLAGELVEALTALEVANDDLASKRSQATYDSMIEDGCSTYLSALDTARRDARALITRARQIGGAA